MPSHGKIVSHEVLGDTSFLRIDLSLMRDLGCVLSAGACIDNRSSPRNKLYALEGLFGCGPSRIRHDRVNTYFGFEFPARGARIMPRFSGFDRA